MSTILSDTFTGSNGTAITSHTPDSGGAWALHTGTNAVIYSNGARAGAGYGYLAHSAAATVDGEACTLSLVAVNANKVGPMVRYSAASGGSFYFVLWNYNTGVIEFWRKKNGALTLLKNTDTYSGTFANMDMSLSVSGTGAAVALDCIINGASRGTYSDTSASRITALGGFGFVFGDAGSDTTGWRIDTITATDSATSPATGTTLSGPSSGSVGTPSTNFTVGVTPIGGTITGTVTITPTDGGDGGTFAPTTVALTTGSPSATFTYTAASPGAKTIGITDDGGLTDATPLAYTASSSDSIAISTPVTGRIHQRAGTTGTIDVAGTYSGTPAMIEARVVQDGTGTPVAGYDWAVAVASPSGGSYSFSLAAVPQGGWYNVQTRFSNATGVNATSGKVGVGLLVALTGQSNSYNWFRSRSTALTPNALVRTYGNIGGWAVPDTANMAGAIACGNALAAALGLPVGMLDYGSSGGSLYITWTPGGTANRAFTDGVAAIGGKLEAVINLVGEGDAVASRSQASCYADYGSLIADWRSQFGQAALPVVLATLGRNTSGSYTDQQWQNIILAQIQKGADTAIYRIDRRDLPLLDTVHHTGPGYETLGQRAAQAIKYIAGSAAYYRGPSVSEVRRVSNAVFDVLLTHRGGNDFSPSLGITEFRVLDGGTPVAVSAAIRLASGRIRLTLGSAPETLPTVQYLYGVTPAVGGVVLDNSAAALPLEINNGVVAVPAHTATVRLVDASGTPRANLSGLKWAWFDGLTPDVLAAPTDQGAGAITDASGYLTVIIPNSAKSSGGIGYLIVTNSDGTTTQSPAPRAFAAPVAVD